MMHCLMCRLALSVSLITAFALAGCVGGPAKNPNFYTLLSAPEVSQTTATVEQRSATVIAVGPVTLPDYLQRPQIVTRTEESQVQLAEFERWAGPLESQIEVVVVRHLSRELPGVGFTGYRQTSAQPDYRITIDVEDFVGRLGGTVDLSVNWVLIRSDGEDQGRGLYTSQVQVPVAGSDYPALVDAHKRALKQLSEQIAAAVRQL